MGQYYSMTKDELHDLARDRDIDGRSQMDKAELIDALEHEGEEAADGGD